MNNFFEDLKKYFEVPPKSKVLEDWAKTESFDQTGPVMDDFLAQTQGYRAHSEAPLQGCTIANNEYNPKFFSGFLFVCRACYYP